LIIIYLSEEIMNVTEEIGLFGADEPITVDELIELVHPLCRDKSSSTIPDLAGEIIAPARRCDDDEQLALSRLCTVYTLILEYLAHAVLSGLADYLMSFDSTYTLKRLLRSVEELSDTLSAAYESSILDAFTGIVARELIDEPF
jgi:hypothetical protein